jgi:predicted NBD/HSP70 family sugar kinase
MKIDKKKIGDKKIIANAAELLRILAETGSATQVELARKSHLKRTSVFYAFEILSRAGMLKQTESVFPGKGRPSPLWSLNPDAGIFLVVYFNNIHNYYALFDFSGKIIHLEEEESSETIQDAMEELGEKIQKYNQKNLCGVMVSLSGMIDSAEGKVVASQTWGLNEFELKNEVKKLFHNSDMLVMIENNSRLAAWGERCQGNCKGVDNFIILHLQGNNGRKRSHPLGIGSGAVLDGRLFKGFQGRAGELDSAFYRWLEVQFPSGNFPFSLGEMNDSQLRDFAAELGEAFAHIANYLAPQKIVLLFDEQIGKNIFFDSFRSCLHKNLICNDMIPFSLETSFLGEKSVFYGGWDLLREAYFANSDQLMRRIRE